MKRQHLTSVWFFCTPGRIQLSPVQLINTDKKAAGVTAPSRKGLCMHGYNTLRKGVVMDSWIQTTILRLLKGWEVEFLLKTTEPMPHKWLYKTGKIVHPMFLGFPSLCETVERRSQQWSTGRACRVACRWVPPQYLSLICLNQTDLPKCVDFEAGTLAWTIHCYSFFLTKCALQSFAFYYWQEIWPQKVPVTVNDQDQRHDIGNYTVQAIDKSSMVFSLDMSEEHPVFQSQKDQPPNSQRKDQEKRHQERSTRRRESKRVKVALFDSLVFLGDWNRNLGSNLFIFLLGQGSFSGSLWPFRSIFTLY